MPVQDSEWPMHGYTDRQCAAGSTLEVLLADLHAQDWLAALYEAARLAA
jgi:hypothetical protein